MKQNKRNTIVLILAVACMLTIAACKKKAPPPPPPPPPPPAPTATLRANPTNIQRGESSTLTWRTENATEVTIDGLGRVEASGSQAVTPENSTTYRLVARGTGPNAEASARVTVTAPPPPPPPPQVSETLAQMFERNVHDIYFDYDKYDIRPDQLGTVQSNARFLRAHPEIRFTIEGHCDERGSTEYNLALGDNRSRAAKQALAEGGVGADRMNTISFGKEKPQCMEHGEECWQRNRRAHFVLQK